MQLESAIDAIHPVGDECFSKLKEIAKYRNLEKNDYFSKTGNFNKEFGFVVNGGLRIFYLSEDGQEHNKHFLLPNSFVTASIKEDKKSITNIQALFPTKLICFEFNSFISLSEIYKPLSTFIQKLIENYLEEKQHREIQLLSKMAKDKYLLFLDNYQELEEIIPHYHIASYLGITPTQLSRIRRELKNVSSHQQM